MASDKLSTKELLAIGIGIGMFIAIALALNSMAVKAGKEASKEND